MICELYIISWVCAGICKNIGSWLRDTRTKSGKRVHTYMNLSERTQPLVSVLIRVRNEEPALRRLFECLRIQRLDRPFEAVVIDNESEDESAEVARRMGARVFTFPRSLFGHGRAINFGVRLCRGDLIVLLSAHSRPQGDDWLSRMVHCVEDGGVAAAYGRQLADGKVCQQEKIRFKRCCAIDRNSNEGLTMQRSHAQCPWAVLWAN